MGNRRAQSLGRTADAVNLLLSLMLACALIGCERRRSNASSGSTGGSTTATTGETSSSSVDRVTVFATVYPLADVARQIGGRWINLDWAVERGQTLESFTPPEDLRGRLNLAQLVISGGSASESWAIQGVGDNSMRAGRALRMTARGADDAQPGENDDDSSTVTGQLWLDPIAVRDFAAAIAQRLVTLRPRGQDEFRRNAGDFQRQINAIVVDYQPRLGGIARRRVLVLSADFNPLLARYGVEPVQPVDQPSPLRLTGDDVAALRNAARTQHLATMLLQADTPRAVADDLASRVGVQVLLLDSFGSSAATGASTYQDLLRSNLDQLAKIK